MVVAWLDGMAWDGVGGVYFVCVVRYALYAVSMGRGKALVGRGGRGGWGKR